MVIFTACGELLVLPGGTVPDCWDIWLPYWLPRRAARAADSTEGPGAWRLTLATLPVAALVAADITARGDVMAEGDDSRLAERHVSAKPDFVDTSGKRGDFADMSPSPAQRIYTAETPSRRASRT